MNHSEIRIEIARRLAGLLDGTIKLPKELRPYQNETLAAMKRWLENTSGTKRSYVSHATGLGKTLIFASVVTACAGLRTLVVVPSKVLIEQTARELYIFTGGMIGHVSSLKNIEDENGEVISMKGHELFDVVLITDASLAKHGWKIAKEFDPHLVIRDECHWTYAEKRQKTMDLYPESVTIGFTATPDYLTNQARSSYIPVTLDNGQVLYAPEDRLARNHYGTCLDERTVRWGIEEGFLAPLAWGHVEFDFSLDGIGTELGEDGSDFRQEDLHALLSEKWQFMQDTVTELYKSGQYGLAGRQVFAVCHNVEGANQMAEALRAIGVSAACITGKTRDIERNAILGAFKSGGIKFVSSVMVLREGWNAPNAEVCLMLRPTKSRVFYVQSMGRVLRVPEDGSAKVALVIDALYQNTEFAPLSAPVLFGYPGQELGDGDLLISERGDASKVKESPYKSGVVKPRLITVEALVSEPEYQLDDSSTVRIGDDLFGTMWGLAQALSLGEKTIRHAIVKDKIPYRTARDGANRACRIYSRKLLEVACGHLLDPSLLVIPDDKDWVEADGEQWTSTALAEKMIGMNQQAIEARLSSAVRSRPGRNRSGKRITLVCLSDVRRVCADVLGVDQRLERDTPVEIEDKLWCTSGCYASLANLGDTQKRKLLRHLSRPANALQKRSARNFSGHIVDIYPLMLMEQLTGQAPGEVLKLGKDGCASLDGEKWSTAKRGCKKHGISARSFTDKSTEDLTTKLGRDHKGRVWTLYRLSDIKRVCGLDLEGLLRVDDTGFAKAGGILWAPRGTIADKHGLHERSVKRRISKTCRSRPGLNRGGHPVTLYAVEDLERECADLIAAKRVNVGESQASI